MTLTCVSYIIPSPNTVLSCSALHWGAFGVWGVQGSQNALAKVCGNQAICEIGASCRVIRCSHVKSQVMLIPLTGVGVVNKFEDHETKSST